MQCDNAAATYVATLFVYTMRNIVYGSTTHTPVVFRPHLYHPAGGLLVAVQCLMDKMSGNTNASEKRDKMNSHFISTPFKKYLPHAMLLISLKFQNFVFFGPHHSIKHLASTFASLYRICLVNTRLVHNE